MQASLELRRTLSRRVSQILSRPGVEPPPGGPVPTGWEGIELARGGVHEWIGVSAASPPYALLAHLAWQALAEREGRVLWIGRGIFPYPRTLVRDFELRLRAGELTLARLPRALRPADPARLLERSLHVDVERPAVRLWALDAALRCPAVTAVVGDASGLDMAATRRLQLAAEAGRGLALLARPPREERQLSAAATRWRVRRAPAGRSAGGNEPHPSWELSLLRKKSVLCPATSH
ncbi:MAG: hypothetical protein AAF682_07395 [Planctomycetota bacterium]